jgi:hypothetical protein
LRRRVWPHWKRDAPTVDASQNASSEQIMGKYFIAWILGVPAGLLLLAYLFFN